MYRNASLKRWGYRDLTEIRCAASNSSLGSRRADVRGAQETVAMPVKVTGAVERAGAVTDRHVRSVSAIEAAQYVPGNGKIVV